MLRAGRERRHRSQFKRPSAPAVVAIRSTARAVTSTPFTVYAISLNIDGGFDMTVSVPSATVAWSSYPDSRGIQTRNRPGSRDKSERPTHRRHEVGTVGSRQPSVFQTVRRCHCLVERRSDSRFLRDGVIRMRVSVDERRRCDIGRCRFRLLDTPAPTVFDEGASPNRLERPADEDSSREYFHTSTPAPMTV